MRRKILCLFTAFFMLVGGITALPVCTAENSVYVGRVNTVSSPLNVRRENGTDSEIITAIDKGSCVFLVSKKDGWWKVEYEKNKFGWCSADYIEETKTADMYVSDGCSALNVRSGKGTSREITDVLQPSQRVSVIKKYDGWSRILYDGTKTGYVCSRYLTEKSGGKYTRVCLDPVLYKQTDPRWANEYLGQSEKTIASCGCTTSCLAMSESYMKNEDIFPDEMEKLLTYSGSGSLCWPAGYETVTDDGVWAQEAYARLRSGKPVIIGAQRENGRQHWVLIKGYDGDKHTLDPNRFLINDPATASREYTGELFEDYPLFLKIVYPTD